MIEEARAIFRELYDEARTLAISTFEGPADEGHPCRYLVRDALEGSAAAPPDWRSSWRTHWQLPETFWGDPTIATPIAFVSVNPSILPGDPCPRHGTSFDEWFDFYRQRMQPGGRLPGFQREQPSLYGYFSEIVRGACDGDADIHTHAIVTDAVHYKCRLPGTANAIDRAIRHRTSLPLTLALLRLVNARVVVIAGAEATRHLGPKLGVPQLASLPVSSAHGKLFTGTDGIQVVVTVHTTYGPNAAERMHVAGAVRAALRGEPWPASDDVVLGIARRNEGPRRKRSPTRDSYTLVVHGLAYEHLNKRELIHLLVKAALAAGASPEQLRRHFPQGFRSWASMEGEVDGLTFATRLAEQRTVRNKSYDVDRFFVRDDLLFHVGGRTYALSNQWGDDRWAAAVQGILRDYPIGSYRPTR
jgi:hypothetical protein